MKILFLCTHNSARSQMAEGLSKTIAFQLGINLEVYSAGTKPKGSVHPLAVEAMREIGIDISGQYSKHLKEVPYKEMDLIVTVCDSAKDECPYVPGISTIRLNLPDPAEVGTLEAFRKVRDILRDKILELLKKHKR